MQVKQKIRSKICGITRPEDGVAAAQLGVDAIGLVFYARSKRCVDVVQAKSIVQALPPFVSVVALFVNETAEKINEILAQVPIDVLQFHGDEEASFCRQFHRPYLKAIRVREADDVVKAFSDYPDARAILLDAFVEGEYGGTGKSFDWQSLPEKLDGQWILAGGLNPENVTTAIAQTGARFVDVSGGVEESAGIKSFEKMKAFLEAIE